jgi:hypothetical protein
MAKEVVQLEMRTRGNGRGESGESRTQDSRIAGPTC